MPPISRIYKGTELVYSAPDTQPLTAFLTNLQPGNRIELFRSANIRSEATISTATFLGVNPHGARGTIIAGPTTGVSNSTWYNINFDVGYDGWCVSDNYVQITSTAVQTTPSYFKVGDNIRLFRAANVRSSAAIAATNLKGVNPKDSLGTITAGPTKTGTINWYNIDFGEEGQDGWVASDNYVQVPLVPTYPPGDIPTCTAGIVINKTGGIPIANAAALKQALTAANSGKTLLLAAGNYGTMSLSGIKPGSRITVVSANASSPAIFNQIKINNCSNLVFADLRFNYNGPTTNRTGKGFFCIEMAGSQNMVVQTSLFVGTAPSPVKGNGFGLKGNDGTSNLLVAGCTFTRLTTGVSFSNVSNSQLVGCMLTAIEYDAIDFTDVHNFLVEGNYVGEFKPPPDLKHQDCIQVRHFIGSPNPTSDLVIKNNVLSTGPSAVHAIYMGNQAANGCVFGECDSSKNPGGPSTYYRNITVTGNTIINTQLHGISIGQAIGVTITNNKLYRDSRSKSTSQVFTPSIGVKAESTNVTITGNTAPKIGAINESWGFIAFPGSWNVGSNASSSSAPPIVLTKAPGC